LDVIHMLVGHQVKIDRSPFQPVSHVGEHITEDL
jgi:hypothetical protein